MFDNNNQNFNNGDPLFGNVQNNGMNNEFNLEPTSNMNYQNNPYEQISNTNSGYVAPNFNFGSNPGYDMRQNMQTNSVDMPPELGEIKNLNDATVSNAPTMDVLGPMNLMPENLPKSNDLLDAYENGNINVGITNINNQTPEQIQNFGMPNNFNIPTNNYQNNGIDGFNNGIENMSQGMNNDYMMNNINPENYNQNSISQNSYSNTNPLPNVAPITSNYEINGNFNFGSEPTMSSYNPNLVGDSVTNFQNFGNDTSNYEQPSDNFNSNILNNIQSTQDFNNDISNELEIQNNDSNLSSDFDINNLNDNENEGYDALVSDEVNKDEDYSLVSNDSELERVTVEEQKETTESKVDDIVSNETEITDLDLDESYNEPDMLEIMDIDGDETDEVEKTNNEETNEIVNEVEPGSVSKNVEKIKSLIEELKAAGADIDLEEFDFESMYQLIVKLNK